MRMLTAFATSFGLALALPVYAQSTTPQLSPAVPTVPEALPDQGPPDQSSSGQIFNSVAIVAVEDLPTEIKAQADAVIAQTSAEDLLRLQSSIDASPQAMSALAALGLNSSQVVAANIDGDGTLTLIIQTTT
ncbi:hypothetical protein D3227_35950 [Mesorhizobium waimense]|uniref:Uncharacterized protein n=1 Tax=Mesorhizobium waimense TaxID=1300307 RepID=A0A3A5JWX1_9HYPH|nr:hypothetical protein [Mesorhizobium waimense]RJT27526.1 hypothetical protein D3227_35950 [Mesorhizobium waimense]